MDNSLNSDKTIKSHVCENVIEEKNDPSTMNLDIKNKNLIANDNSSTNNLDITKKNLILNNNLSKNSVIITKAKKMNEYENIKSNIF